MADAQFITKIINSMVLDDQVAADGTHMSPKAMLNWLTRVYYNRRSKIDPLWNQVVVAGFDRQTSQPMLGCVNLLGYSWQDSVVATGKLTSLQASTSIKAICKDLFIGSNISKR